MNTEDIEKFLAKNIDAHYKYVKISFKKRKEVYGLFVRDRDYDHLKSKNFWRIVTKLSLDEFSRTGDLSLSRIFNGSEFSRLSTYEGLYEEANL
jgi:hypothetical protein